MLVDNIPEKVIETDVLVIGGGVAGCFAAIKAKEHGVDVVIVDKGYSGKSGQTPSTNTFAVCVPGRHDPQGWVEQVNSGGHNMNDRDWTEIVVNESYERWKEFAAMGAEVYKWDPVTEDVFVSPATKDDGEIVKLPLFTEAYKEKYPVEAFRYPIRKNAEVLRRAAAKAGVKLVDRVMITDLLKQDGRIVGAVGVPADSYECLVFKAKATVMCAANGTIKSNGLRTYVATGDADAMAYRVGCEITGKEWTDNHPVRADFPAWPWSGVDRDRYRSYRGEAKGHLKRVNAYGQELHEFFGKEVWVADALEAHKGNAPIYIDSTSGSSEWFAINTIPKGYPRSDLDTKMSQVGLVRMVYGRAVGQSVHLTDGIWPVGKECSTQVPGLFAAGDSLGARAIGCCYPAQGFAMATCSVTGARAGEGAAEYALQVKKEALDKDELARVKKIALAPLDRKGGFSPGWITQVLQNALMPYWVLSVKHADRLNFTLAQIEFIRDHVMPKMMARDTHDLRLAHETKSIILNAEMKLRASLMRTETRGSHCREDYPAKDDSKWLVWIKIKEESGGMTLSTEPVPKKWWPDAAKN